MMMSLTKNPTVLKLGKYFHSADDSCDNNLDETGLCFVFLIPLVNLTLLNSSNGGNVMSVIFGYT